MRNNYCIVILILLMLGTYSGQAQDKRTLQYFRQPGFNGLNHFETTKDTSQIPFSEVKVRVGGDFALQFQSLNHSTKSGDTLANIGSNFNLPAANLNLDVQLE